MLPLEVMISGPILLLKAFAVENLLKGCLVEDGAEPVKDGKFVGFKGVVNPHDLNELSGKIGLNVSEYQKDILKRLTLYIELGRYPFPTKFDKVKIQSKRNGSQACDIPASWTYPTDDEEYKKIVHLIYDRLGEGVPEQLEEYLSESPKSSP